MLIDDDEPTNFLSRIIIEEADCTEHIQIEDGGERALKYLLNSKKSAYNSKQYPWPDLIFLDINMPAMNGWEFLEKYKELRRENDSDTIIIMLTTSFNPDDKNKANGISDVTDFKHKPLTEEMINEVLSKYFVDCVKAIHIPLNAEKIYNLN